MLGWDSLPHAAIAFGVALFAGMLNAIAGGGTNISFPTLVWLGLSPISANATSAVALWPGSLGGALGFRQDIERGGRGWLWLAVPSLAGGALGAYLLIHTPSSFFKSIAPWLVIGSSALIVLDPMVKKRVGGADTPRSRGWRLMAVAAQFVISIYGGYFGAGIGILMLTSLGLLGLRDIHQANGLKNIYALAIKGVAVLYFVVQAIVVWHAALTMAVGAIIGGYASAAVGRRVKGSTMRWVVAAVGVGMGVAMFVEIL